MNVDRKVWLDLFEQCPEAPPFLHPAWLESWWEVFGGAPLKPVIVPGAMALCFEYEGRLVFVGNGITDQLDILCCDQQSAKALVDELRNYSLDLQEIPEGSPLLAIDHEPCSVSPVVDLTQPPPKNMRRNMNVARRDLEKLGTVNVVHTCGPELLDDLFRLHAARWQADGESGVLADPRVERFHRLAASRLAEAGMLRMHAILLSERVVGVVYAFRRGSTLYSYLGGYEPELREYSPGALAIEAAMEHARDEGCTRYDFLRGAEKYKYLWGATDRTQYRIRT